MTNVSSWLWILGGVVIGTMIILFATTMLLRFQDNNQKLFSVDAYGDFVSRVSMVCNQFVGNVDFYNVKIPDVVRAIYPTEYRNDLPPDKVSVNITNMDYGVGNYICMQFFDESTARCSEKLKCDINMTYIGTPSQQNSLQDLIAKIQGKYPSYTYILTINKTDAKDIIVRAERRLTV